MRKIIGGKKYDSLTAEKLAEWNNGGFYGDFTRSDQTLYRKKTGEFFLCSEGAERRGGGEIGFGEEIIPLSEREARDWAEDHISDEEYEEIFGEVAE